MEPCEDTCTFSDGASQGAPPLGASPRGLSPRASEPSIRSSLDTHPLNPSACSVALSKA